MAKGLRFSVFFALLVLILCITVSADDFSGKCGEEASFKFDQKTGTLTIYGSGSTYDYCYEPGNIKSSPWYSYNNDIKHIVVEEGITRIGEYAFYFAHNAETATVADSVTAIASHGFNNCQGLREVTLSDNITTLSEFSFGYAKSLTSIRLPKKLTLIGKYAFVNSDMLESIVFPEGLKSIEESAFVYCHGLREAVIPRSVINIGEMAFYDCPQLIIYGYMLTKGREYAVNHNIAFKEIKEIPEDPSKCGEEAYWSFDSATRTLTISGSGKMHDFASEFTEGKPIPWSHIATGIRSVVVEKGITYVGHSAFYSLSNLRSVTISDSVTEIGGWAFSLCTSMESFVLPSTVKRVGEYALAYCYMLKSIELSDGITDIPPYFLIDCDELTSVKIPSTVTEIGEGAFSNCDKLIAVYFPSSVKSISENIFRDFGRSDTAIYTAKGSYSEKYAKEKGLTYVIADSELDFEIVAPVHSGTCGENIEWNFNSHSGTLLLSGRGRMDDLYYTDVADDKDVPQPWSHLRDKITSVVIHDDISYIGRCAFLKLENLRSVELPYSLDTIGDYAFAYCKELKEIKFRDLKTIGANAFLYCTSLERIKIPNGTKRILNGAFSCCEGLRELLLPKSLEFIGEKAFWLCGSLETIDIPNGIRYIERSAFASCKKLQMLIIPDSVEEIGMGIVNGCDKLTVYTDNGYVKGFLKNESIVCKSVTDRLSVFKRDNLYSGQFKDVKDSDWFAQNVKGAYESGLMLGTSEKEFSPTQNITVAQVVTLAARIHSIYYTGRAEFEQGEVWYQVYADYMKDHIYGYTTLVSSSDYDTLATREQVVKILYSALPKAAFTPINSIAGIPDYKDDTGAVTDFYNAGILTGRDAKGSFIPKAYITRAEIAAIVTRMIDASLRVRL